MMVMFNNNGNLCVNALTHKSNQNIYEPVFINNIYSINNRKDEEEI